MRKQIIPLSNGNLFSNKKGKMCQSEFNQRSRTARISVGNVYVCIAICLQGVDVTQLELVKPFRWGLFMHLVLECGVHRVCSWETKTGVTWKKQEQAGTRRTNWHLHVTSQSPALMMWISWGKVALCQISKFWCLVPGIREAEWGSKEKWHIVSQTAAPHQQVEPASQLQHVRAAEVPAWKKNGGYFPSALQTSRWNVSCETPFLEAYQEENSGKQFSLAKLTQEQTTDTSKNVDES